jgi:hypothetical protein
MRSRMTSLDVRLAPVRLRTSSQRPNRRQLIIAAPRDRPARISLFSQLTHLTSPDTSIPHSSIQRCREHLRPPSGPPVPPLTPTPRSQLIHRPATGYRLVGRLLVRHHRRLRDLQVSVSSGLGLSSHPRLLLVPPESSCALMPDATLHVSSTPLAQTPPISHYAHPLSNPAPPHPHYLLSRPCCSGTHHPGARPRMSASARASAPAPTARPTSPPRRPAARVCLHDLFPTPCSQSLLPRDQTYAEWETPTHTDA